MRSDSRLSGILHVLLHMAEADRPLTSEQLAAAMRTNPVVVRRIMAGLRDDGLLVSNKGHGGGWRLAKPPEAITLRDVYDALGAPAVFALCNRSEAPECPVERAVNAAMDEAFAHAEAVLLARFGTMTLAALGADVRALAAARKGRCGFGAEAAS